MYVLCVKQPKLQLCPEIRIMIDAVSQDTTGRRGAARRGFENEIERNGVEQERRGVRAENGRMVCKSAERRGG